MQHEDLNPPAIVKTAKSPEEELAERIKAREEKVVKATLEHARLQGEDLLRVKRLLDNRKFAPWLKSHRCIGRTTAYLYMKVAKKWDVICSRAEQIKSLRQVLRWLLDEGKTKQRGSPPTPETDSPVPEPTHVHGNDEEACSGTAPGEKLEAGPEVDDAVVSEPEEGEPNPESERHEEQNQHHEEKACGEQNAKPDRKPRKKGRERPRRAQAESMTGKPTNALVMPIKDPSLHVYFQDLLSELHDLHRAKKLFCGGIFPPNIHKIMREEDLSVQLFLAVIQLRITMSKSVEEWKESKQRNEKETQQRAGRKRK